MMTTIEYSIHLVEGFVKYFLKFEDFFYQASKIASSIDLKVIVVNKCTHKMNKSNLRYVNHMMESLKQKKLYPVERKKKWIDFSP